MMKYHTPDFYERLTPRDRIAVDAISKWLRPVGWQWFVTLTFPWNVKSETAVCKLRQCIDGLERHHRARVCFVAGQESMPRRHGMSVPNHFHLLLASHAPLSAEAIKALWLAQVMRRSSQDRGDGSVLIESYQAHRRGLEYCLKAVNDAYGDWLIHRLEHFLPGATGPSKPNHQSVRSTKRDMEQLVRLATSLAP